MLSDEEIKRHEDRRKRLQASTHKSMDKARHWQEVYDLHAALSSGVAIKIEFGGKLNRMPVEVENACRMFAYHWIEDRMAELEEDD